MSLPKPFQDVINAFSRLPGIGPKTASRLTFYLWRSPQELSLELAHALLALKTETSVCPRCFFLMASGQGVCEICADSERQRDVLCVVEEALDVIALERSGVYRGLYHVLQGVLSPIEGVGPQDLRIAELLQRLEREAFQEVILATNPSLEGEATAMYLKQRLQGYGVKVTRLARGLPVGGDLEYADPNTLLRALLGRQEMGGEG
ncbi:MAG: recombination mediator RecR [Anaerolineales bacterium]|nr:recombination mediator RecR [Anaerolineales bacterium]MCS7248842.1 recombination mediator RecR [Anaerolineales bacterium]MDW8162655.1 recombination mediator RecR [Anaerolineales bacterium]MDW8447800.1 recombination mediator RecR [Anaerolineales bacterium]